MNITFKSVPVVNEEQIDYRLIMFLIMLSVLFIGMYWWKTSCKPAMQYKYGLQSLLTKQYSLAFTVDIPDKAKVYFTIRKSQLNVLRIIYWSISSNGDVKENPPITEKMISDIFDEINKYSKEALCKKMDKDGVYDFSDIGDLRQIVSLIVDYALLINMIIL